jgi:hypothetical protein
MFCSSAIKVLSY